MLQFFLTLLFERRGLTRVDASSHPRGSDESACPNAMNLEYSCVKTQQLDNKLEINSKP